MAGSRMKTCVQGVPVLPLTPAIAFPEREQPSKPLRCKTNPKSSVGNWGEGHLPATAGEELCVCKAKLYI